MTAPDSHPDAEQSPITPEWVRERWDDFSEAEAAEIGSSVPLLVNALQDKYGRSEDEATREVLDFVASLDRKTK